MWKREVGSQSMRGEKRREVREEQGRQRSDEGEEGRDGDTHMHAHTLTRTPPAQRERDGKKGNERERE